MGETPACRATSAIVTAILTLLRGGEVLRTGWSFSIARFSAIDEQRVESWLIQIPISRYSTLFKTGHQKNDCEANLVALP
jgi:hypothetical protein